MDAGFLISMLGNLAGLGAGVAAAVLAIKLAEAREMLADLREDVADAKADRARASEANIALAAYCEELRLANVAYRNAEAKRRAPLIAANAARKAAANARAN